jgi:hypothetical protein
LEARKPKPKTLKFSFLLFSDPENRPKICLTFFFLSFQSFLHVLLFLFFISWGVVVPNLEGNEENMNDNLNGKTTLKVTPDKTKMKKSRNSMDKNSAKKSEKSGFSPTEIRFTPIKI